MAIERVRLRLPTKSILMVGLRGVGKTVLLDRMRDDAEASGIQTVRRSTREPILARNFGPSVAASSAAAFP